MGEVFCKRGLKPHQLDQAVLPFHSSWQTWAAWLLFTSSSAIWLHLIFGIWLVFQMCRRPGQIGVWSTRQWRPVVASQWMNIATSFSGRLEHLHKNHYVLLFSQMPPALWMIATLPLLKIHRRCSLAYSPRLLSWQTFFWGVNDITQVREKPLFINPSLYLLLDKKTL